MGHVHSYTSGNDDAVAEKPSISPTSSFVLIDEIPTACAPRELSYSRNTESVTFFGLLDKYAQIHSSVWCGIHDPSER